jgi:putative membrane protein
MADMPWRTLRVLAQREIRRNVELTVEGRERVPDRGPVLLAARHFHHLYDGACLLATLDRPAHIIVGLDWIQSTPLRVTLTGLCRAAKWPVIYRSGSPNAPPDQDIRAALRTATKETLALLENGRIVIVFPEAYPNIDPGFTPKLDDETFLPFASGVVRLATLAAMHGMSTPIVPVGFEYAPGDRWHVTMRFGTPRFVRGRDDEQAVLSRLEQDVRILSCPV